MDPHITTELGLDKHPIINVKKDFCLSDYEGIQWLAKTKYSRNTYEHACRVADYAFENYRAFYSSSPVSDFNEYYVKSLAIAHDLLEDTDISTGDILECVDSVNDEWTRDKFIFDLELLTRSELLSYNQYISVISELRDKCPATYIVKLADMKDHLNLKDTLTDKLKAKYLDALAILL